MKKLTLITALLTSLTVIVLQVNTSGITSYEKDIQNEELSKNHTAYLNIYNLPPVAICQDITVNANDSCMAVVLPIQVDSGSYDPDGDSLIFSLSPEGPYPLGITEVVLTVTDTAGDYDQCIANIMVVDSLVPTVLTQSITIYFDSNGMAIITPEDIDNGSFDNCSIDTMMLDTFNFTCENIGANVVTLTVMDYSGNDASAMDTVFVMDSIPPQLTVTTDTILLWPPNHKYEDFTISDFVVSVWDNCSNLTMDDVNFTRATSDEPENGTGDGNTIDDIVISNECQNISVRKERQGSENGRVYTIYLTLVDENDLADSAVCYVFVPHNQGSMTIDDGPVYEVIGDCNNYTAISEFGEDHTHTNEEILTSFPNPFSKSTNIKFYLSEGQNVELEVYNIQGKLVSVLSDGFLPEGDHSFNWNGLNVSGQKIDDGIYLIRFVTSEKVQLSRIVKM